MKLIALIMFCYPCLGFAAEIDLTLKLPPDCAPKSASANATHLKLSTPGQIDAKNHDIIFKNLLPDTPYDLALTLSDGTILQGVNLNWYGLDAPKPGAAHLDDDDRKAITDLVNDPKAFENKKAILFLNGDNTRATVLVELIRDKDFHAADGNIIWRVELWYFENQFGGWAKVVQQSKVLRRERFKDKAAFDDTVKKLKWIPELGGIKLPKDQPTTEITLPTAAFYQRRRPKSPAINEWGEPRFSKSGCHALARRNMA
jgi:hypothetical protein